MTRPVLRVVASSVEPKPRRFDPSSRGYSMLYRGADTSCPGCGRTNWIIGRFSAECGFCATALPLAPETTDG